jgi:membrane protease YdiL (CAAX protease family)
VPNEEIINADYNAPLTSELAAISPEKEPPTPDNPPWNGWIAIGVWVMSIAFIFIFPLLFVTPYLISQHVDISDKARLAEIITTDKTAILLQLLSVIPAHLLTLVLGWAVATNLKKYSFRQTLGWDLDGFKIWYAFAITAAFFALGIAFKFIFPEQENEMDKMIKSSQAAVFLVAFFATFTAPLVEELVYRGILYSALQRRFGITLAVAFVTLLFAAIHIPQYSSNNVPDYGTIILLLLLSLVLTLIRVKTKNLLPCIVLHTVFNGIQSVLLLLQPFLDVPHEKTAPNLPETAGLIIHHLKIF